MKTIVMFAALVLFFAWMVAMARAAGDPDVIFITRLRPFILQPSTNRPDHKEFFIQVFSHSRRFELTKTNELLTIHDLRHVPDGPAFLVVQSICVDGDKSPEIPFDIDIRKDRPGAPKIKAVTISEEESLARTMEDLRFIRNRTFAMENPIPAPPGAIPEVNHPPMPPVMPNATNRPYLPQFRRNE